MRLLWRDTTSFNTPNALITSGGSYYFIVLWPISLVSRFYAALFCISNRQSSLMWQNFFHITFQLIQPSHIFR